MAQKINLFFVDDETAFLDLIAKVFSSDKYNLDVFSSGRELLRKIDKKDYDVGIIDIKMPDIDGLELLKLLRKQNLMTEYIMLTGQASVSTALESMKLGCYDYLIKPVNFDELELVIQKACEKRSLNRENAALREELHMMEKYYEMVGKSAAMRDVFSLIDRVAKTPSLVIVTGESGTGKELVARAIHKNSDRRDKPFIIIDCASLPEQLLENELFGHEQGAFTDASSLKRGLFEIADGGTLFIDEIGEMKLSVQAKLLRVIETHQFRRLGGERHINADVRIVAATNRDLADEVKKGNFRQDLYYRLNVVPVHLPPLRERREDIPLLVEHFIAKKQGFRERKKVSAEAMQLLMNYEFPGNVRELANVIERSLIVATGEYILPRDLPLVVNGGKEGEAASVAGRGLSELVEEFEKNTILRVLKECGDNRTEAAKRLKLSRAQFYRKLEKLGIEE